LTIWWLQVVGVLVVKGVKQAVAEVLVVSEQAQD